MTIIGIVSPLVHRPFLSTSKRRSADGGRNHLKLCWLVKTMNKAAYSCIANLPVVAPESNAEEWCSAVDIGGKEGFINLERIERAL
jgi:hypothetical protein